MKTMRLSLSIALLFLPFTTSAQRHKYPYVEYDNGAVIVSRDNQGGVHPDALAGDMENRIEETLQVQESDAKSDAVGWLDAQRACVDGWRLPTKRELQLIWLTGGGQADSYSQCKVAPVVQSALNNIPEDKFTSLEPADYWTLTPDKDSYWHVSFANGEAASGAGICRVRCVKGHRQAAGTFAYSNIVMIGGKLTFAEKRIDDDEIDGFSNEDIPANSQGIHFRFGSLVGISSAGEHGTEFDSSHVVFCPTEYTKPTIWNEMPYHRVSDSTYFTPEEIQAGAIADDHLMEKFTPIGYDVSQGLGDICRYISDQGWVKGRWRIPTATEIWQTMKSSTGTTGDCHGIVSTSPTWDNLSIDNTNGTYKISNGWWFGEGATDVVNTAEDKIIAPENTVFFPAGGNRTNPIGMLNNPGLVGYHWSSTAYNNGRGLNLTTTNVAAYISDSDYRNGFPIRCVAE